MFSALCFWEQALPLFRIKTALLTLYLTKNMFWFMRRSLISSLHRIASIWIFIYLNYHSSLGLVYLDPIRWPASSWLVSSLGRALHRYLGGHWFKFRAGLNFFQVLFTTTRFSSVLSCEDLLISSFFGWLAIALEALSFMSQQHSGLVFCCEIRCFHLHSTKNMFLMICRKIAAFQSVCSELSWVLLDLT